MEASNHFKQTIQNYLEQRAQTDALFAPRYANPKKNIDDCVTYILNTVKNLKINGFEDDEIYAMALHYYDEDDIQIGKKISCHAVVNHTIQLTEEEKEQARKNAMQRAENDAYKKITKPVRTAKKSKSDNQPTLF